MGIRLVHTPVESFTEKEKKLKPDLPDISSMVIWFLEFIRDSL